MPRTGSDTMLLQIKNPSATKLFASNCTEIADRPLRCRRQQQETIVRYQQSLDYVDQPLHILLQGFGKLIPTAYISRDLETIATTRNPYHHVVELSLVCFHSLHRIASIKIEWVDSLSAHLEFDPHTKVLKIFRFPSLCLIMARNEKSSPLSQ